MPLPYVLRELVGAPGPSGYEQPAAEVFRQACASFAHEVVRDTLGSTVARVRGTGGGPTLAVIGHIDEIGLIVRHIDDKGRLWFAGVGGWDTTVLVAQRVEVLTREGRVRGVIGRTPIHLLKEEDRKKAPELKQLHIDIGAADAEDAARRVRVGDVAVISAEPLELGDDRLIARSLDNRLGCFVAHEAARLVAEGEPPAADVCAVAAVQEEVTFAGAATTAYSLRPDVAIVVDVTFATDVPGADETELGSHALGSGPVITRGATLDPQVFDLLYDTAVAEGIPFTVEASARRTGTDADAVHLSRAGVPSGLVLVPLRYMHSPVEMVQLSDVHNAARLIAAFARRLDSRTDFRR